MIFDISLFYNMIERTKIACLTKGDLIGVDSYFPAVLGVFEKL